MERHPLGPGNLRSIDGDITAFGDELATRASDRAIRLGAGRRSTPASVPTTVFLRLICHS